MGTSPCHKCGDLDGCWYDKVRSVYVASSWRNDTQPAVVAALRAHGLDVYDFRCPESHFRWDSIDPDWLAWTPEQFVAALDHPNARFGFDSDFSAMQRCDACLMVQPCGVSAALEAAWFAGRGKPVAALLAPGPRFEPELMLAMLDDIFVTFDEALGWLDDAVIRRDLRRHR